MTQLRDELIRRTKDALTGAAVVNPQLGVGSIILIDLAIGSAPVPGKSYMRIECAWRLETATAVLAASEDPHDVLATHVQSLQGRSIRDAEVLSPSLELRLSFDDGKRLIVFPLYANMTDDYDNWILRTPDGKALIAGPGRGARIVNADEPRR
jgi:hypothetical protein